MTAAKKSNPVEIIAIVIGLLAIVASAYFIFLTESNSYRLTNWVISAAFLVYVVNNFINIRNLKTEVGTLTDQKNGLSSDLKKTKKSLSDAKADVEVIKADLIDAQNELKKREEEIKKLKVS
ncbi:MAG: hypothetical protein ACO3JZ_01110 [Schleiferiaceae bacterium]|jgi:peptidoglycan hydrolase CwlO-like protein|nr:hypothetical protein [Schleiferiaceae bacterium]MDA8570293.1 hypothetical protein [Schleiferiaceae bacterium]MDA8819433.1 hypothetical protein [Schleiferiaceae bacterium]MDB3991595.1 hypothetical protein [Schleiferiaceae bacterium]